MDKVPAVIDVEEAVGGLSEFHILAVSMAAPSAWPPKGQQILVVVAVT